MLRRITRLIAGVLAAGLLLALAPSASAAATYDITQVGDANWVGVTSNGRELSEQTVASNNVPVTASIHIGIDDMAALKEGDAVTVEASVISGSHFWPNLFSSSNLPTYLADGSGRKLLTVSVVSNRVIRLIRTGEVAQGTFSCDLQVSNTLWISNNATSSEWHIGESSVYTFSNQATVSKPCTWNSEHPNLAAGVSNAQIELNGFVQNCRTMTDLAKGSDTSYVSTDSLVMWAHVTPEAGSITGTQTWGNQVWVQRAYDENTPGATYDDRSNTRYFPAMNADVSTLDKAKANLKPGAYASQALADGSWVIATNLGSRLPGLDNSLQVLDKGDAATLKLLAKTGHIRQNAQFIIRVRFADESIPNRVRVETQSTESAYRTTTLTTKPVRPAVGQGQSAIRYDPNGGDGDAFKKVGDPGTTATTAEAGVFLRKGHTFAGWNTKADGTGTAYQAGADVAYPAEGDTLTLYAQWEANTYKTEFRDWRGRTITSGTARYGSTPTVPALADTTWLADPDMNFDNVDGWNDGNEFVADGKLQTNRDNKAINAEKQVTESTTVHTDYDADYTQAKVKGILGWYRWDSDDNPLWGGYACQPGQKCKGNKYDTVSGAGILTAFTQLDSWNDYGTATVHHMQLTQVDPATHNGIARDGYVFTGWDKDVTKPITGDTVYTARYRPAVYRIRFDGNGSTSGAMSDQLFTYGTPQALTAATFQRDGYSLTGWNTRPDGTGKSFTDKQTVADLLTHENAVGTLYAQWAPTPPVITVVFHSNDGGTDETVKRVWASNNLDMKAIGLPDGWTKKGFVFHGWNLAADGSGVEYKTGESLYGRMTTATVDLYADWAGLQSTLPQAGGSTKAPAYGAGLALMVLGAGAWLSAGRRRRMA